jgi:signal transduction histidine kinase
MEKTQGNILIADDKPDNLRLLSRILTDEGHKVRKVLDGNRALDAAQVEPPDLILLDIMMPEIDGYEVCQMLKANERTQAIPVIFLSALDDIEDKVKAFSVGGVDYITKPFQKEEVIARVKTHLHIQALTRDLKHKNSLLAEEIEQRKVTEADLKTALQDLRTAQEQIIAREKLASLGALTAGIAHELRNPLNFVKNYAEGSIELAEELKEEVESQLQYVDSEAASSMREILADIKENAMTIRQHGLRAAQIISSMMQHARSEVGKFQLTDLNSLLADAINLIYNSKRVQHPGFDIAIETSYDSDIGQIDVLPSELSRVFINLIENACYAVQKKRDNMGEEFAPKLSVKTQKLGNTVEIRIRDNGMGIDTETQAKIFEPFFTTKPVGEGTGLGLSIAHNIIVSQHGGILKLETELNVYTEFVIILPLQSRSGNDRDTRNAWKDESTLSDASLIIEAS